MNSGYVTDYTIKVQGHERQTPGSRLEPVPQYVSAQGSSSSEAHKDALRLLMGEENVVAKGYGRFQAHANIL